VGIIREVEVGTGILAGSLATMRPLLSSIITRIKSLYRISNRIGHKTDHSRNTSMVLEAEELNIGPAPNQMTLPYQLSTVVGDIDPLPIRDGREEAKATDLIRVRSVKISMPQMATDRHEQA
jgi:hypothetical protein